MKEAASFLREWLESQDLYYASFFAGAYAAVAVRLSSAEYVKETASFLRQHLEQAPDGDTTSRFAEAYAAVVARLDSVEDVMAVTKVLRVRLEEARDPGTVSSFARAYAAVACAMLERVNSQQRSMLVREILMLVGYPFVKDPTPLLAALKPTANRDFGGDVRAAVYWAMENYDIKPDQLRPSSLLKP